MAQNPQIDAILRQGFKYFNRFMLLMWRLGLGRWADLWPAVAGRIMVLTHTGRKSKQRRRTPLNYAVVDGAIYITAGFGGVSDWYRNILADPAVEVWLAHGRWDGAAEEVSTAENRLPLLREVLRGSGVVTYMVGIDPNALSDADLDAATSTYKLVRIRRTAPRTGPGGPGDLAWVWLVVMGVAGLVWWVAARPGRASNGAR